jgi:hypothetical protein
MPSFDFAVNQTVPIVGSAATKQLVAASAGNAIFLVQLVVEGTAADTTIILQDASGGTTLLALALTGAGTLVLPATGAWWARTTIGNALFFTAAATTNITAYYLIR